MLDRLQPRKGSTHAPKRVGRGPGSGLHKTSGRGMKGQGHRSPGRETPFWFEGGQMPFVHGVCPSAGFFNLQSRTTCQIVNVSCVVGARRRRNRRPPRPLLAHGPRESGATASVGQNSRRQGDAPKNLTVVKVQKHQFGRAIQKIESSQVGRVETHPMIGGVQNIARITELRNRILFTFGMLAVYRLGAFIRHPGDRLPT